VGPTLDPTSLYTERNLSYERLIRIVAYPQGIRAYFLRSQFLRSNIHSLDAGCGSGTATLALRKALLSRGLSPGLMRGFDLTPKMLESFSETLLAQEVEGVELFQADILHLDELPDGWNNFDLIVSAAMLEYLPRDRMVEALSDLRSLLKESGSLLLFITRRNWLMSLLIGKWWSADLYGSAELEKYFRLAGFTTVTFRNFPFPYKHLSLWGHIIEAK